MYVWAANPGRVFCLTWTFPYQLERGGKEGKTKDAKSDMKVIYSQGIITKMNNAKGEIVEWIKFPFLC